MFVSGHLGVVYVSKLVGSCHGGLGMSSGVTGDCFEAKCVCSVSNIICGLEVISLVCGSLMVASCGCSSGRCFEVIVVFMWALFVQGILSFPNRVRQFMIYLGDYGGDGFVADGGDVF